MVKTSDKIGTLLKVDVPSSANNVAAKIGSTAFFAPSICTVPSNCLPPRTMISSIVFPPKNASRLFRICTLLN